MNQRDLARLLVKIAALAIIIAAFETQSEMLARLIGGTSHKSDLAILGLSFTPVSFALFAGLGLFWWAGPLVDRTLVRPSSDDKTAPFDLRGFEEIALTVLGVYVLVAGLAQGAYYWAKWWGYNDLLVLTGGVPRVPLPPDQLAGLFAAGTRIILGTVLIFASRGLVTFKRRVLILRTIAPGRPVSRTIGDREI
jgi:hypothetical protein